jgi:2-polyprenyl-3-methyl-5-hydroxy-6-metoxy-1,4-benzoquinol methylase
LNEHQKEVADGQRFEFGANWAKFLSVLNDERIAVAEQSLKEKLGVHDLKGKRFLDIGSGSGLFSLAARKLGASVHSFDYDMQSVACTAELRRRYFPEDLDWKVEQGSVLTSEYLENLGEWDIVYSWGVLHHTGSQWQALGNVAPLVRKGGLLFIALYNDQGKTSQIWKFIKMLYNRLPKILRIFYTIIVMGPRELKFLSISLIIKRNFSYFSYINNYSSQSLRGMSYWHDVVDWIGGYPFEVSTPEEIFEFYHQKGFQLEKLKTCGGGLGCNEFVFRN